MKLISKILKILFGFSLFFYSAAAMLIAPAFTSRYFSTDILRATELIMFYLAVHGISIVVWAVKNQPTIHDFRIETQTEN